MIRTGDSVILKFDPKTREIKRYDGKVYAYESMKNAQKNLKPCEKDAILMEYVPVVHGRWEDKPTGRYGQWQSWCSACGKHSGIGGIEKNRHRAYCPNCGARMDGVDQ